jgi:hypothetical protein
MPEWLEFPGCQFYCTVLVLLAVSEPRQDAIFAPLWWLVQAKEIS